MRIVAEFIGWGFILASILGAIVPGWNFHVAFAGDEAAREWHIKIAQRIADRQAAQKATDAR